MPSMTGRDGFGSSFGLGVGLAFGAACVFFGATALCVRFLTACKGLITLVAAGEVPWPRPRSMKPPPSARTATRPAAAKIRTRSVTLFLSALAACVLKERMRAKERARSPAPFRKPPSGVLAAAGLDVARGAGLVVRSRARDGVANAVQRRVG